MQEQLAYGLDIILFMQLCCDDFLAYLLNLFDSKKALIFFYKLTNLIELYFYSKAMKIKFTQFSFFISLQFDFTLNELH